MISDANIKDLAKQIAPLISDAFCTQLFEASILNLEDKKNPLRINNFAYALRGLLDNVLAIHSPLEKIENCSWFDPESHVYLRDNRKVPNRAAQIKFAIQFNLHDEYVSTTLGNDIESHVKTLNKVYQKLNGFTHITESTFNVAEKAANVIIEGALGAVLEFLSLIVQFKDELYRNLETKVYDAVNLQSTLENLPSLEEIATHVSIEEIYIDKYWIKQIDDTYIVVASKGTISVVHQWGSNSDVRNGDGAEIEHSHPFDSEIYFYCDDPQDWDAEQSYFNVDTSDWWDGYYDER